MALVFDDKPLSSDSLLGRSDCTLNDSEEDDLESQLPSPEPLGTAKILTSSTISQNKRWPRRRGQSFSLLASKNPPKKSSSKADKLAASSLLPTSKLASQEGKVGFILLLAVLIVGITTLVTVQFRDSEFTLALFAVLVLFVLGVVYYINCCRTLVKAGDGIISASVAPELEFSELPSGTSIPQSALKADRGPGHRRDWSLPIMPSSTNQYSRLTPVFPASSSVKQQVQFPSEDPIGSRVAYISSCLEQFKVKPETAGINEARLADAITTVFTTTMDPSQLTEIKRAVDRELRNQNISDNFSSLHSAVFTILPKAEKDAVLTHFAAVNAIVEDKETAKPIRMIISDIDDTLVPTFKDRRGFTWGVPYPGVRQLYKELSNCIKDESQLRELVSFVTARPGMLRSWTQKEITKAGFEGSTILMGYATTATSPQGMLNQKVKQVRELKALWPECSVVLIGDNGQRDIDLGMMLLEENLVEAVFIHDIFASDEEMMRTTMTTSSEDEIPMLTDEEKYKDVQPKPMNRLVSAPAALDTSDQDPTQQSHRVLHVEPSFPVGFRHDECDAAGIALFQTYAGAALSCFQKGLITVDQLENVTRACAVDLGAMKSTNKQHLVDGLLRDIARVALEFHHKSAAEMVEFLDYVHDALKQRV